MGAYTIRTADADEHDDDIRRIEEACALPRCPYEDVSWWLTFFEGVPIAYLGIMQSILFPRAAYLTRVGVLKEHRGNGLQLRLMRTAERFARRQGFAEIVSDTTENVPSANNFIRAGYRLFEPPSRWAFQGSQYWRKVL